MGYARVAGQYRLAGVPWWRRSPGTPSALRADYNDVVLEKRLLSALFRINPGLLEDAIYDAWHRLTRPDGTTLEARNRTLHRMLVNGVTVEYGRNGSVRGAQAQVMDFAECGANDWLAVSQFTVEENRRVRRPDIVLFVNGLPLLSLNSRIPLMKRPRSGLPISSFRPTRQTYLRCSPSTQHWSYRTVCRRESER